MSDENCGENMHICMHMYANVVKGRSVIFIAKECVVQPLFLGHSGTYSVSGKKKSATFRRFIRASYPAPVDCFRVSVDILI